MKRIKCISPDPYPHFIEGKTYEVRGISKFVHFDQKDDIKVWDEDGRGHELSVDYRQMHFERPRVLRGKEWNSYLRAHKLTDKKQEEMYVCTHNYHSMYKIGHYYFCFEISRGYLDLTSLKRLV